MRRVCVKNIEMLKESLISAAYGRESGWYF